MIKEGVDIKLVESSFVMLVNMFSEFGITVNYPQLFIDTLDESIHRFDARCDIFALFTPSESIRQALTNSNLIADMHQVGIYIESDRYTRKAIVSIPNF